MKTKRELIAEVAEIMSAAKTGNTPAEMHTSVSRGYETAKNLCRENGIINGSFNQIYNTAVDNIARRENIH